MSSTTTLTLSAPPPQTSRSQSPSKRKPTSKFSLSLPTVPVIACLSYATCSTALTLANKHVFSTDLNYPWTLLTIQSFLVTLLLATYQLFRFRRAFSLSLTRQMLFPCILFTLYIYTNSRALRSVSLPILSVLKSLCPLGIAIAERLVFKDVIAPGTASAMVLVVIGNAVTVMNDIEYTPVGYAWSFANVAINIAYLLSLRLCLSDSFTPLEKTMHSNMIACFIMFPISFANNEHPAFIHDFHATNTTYRVVYFFSCLLAAGIGASIFWVVQTTSGATLSFVGACNKFSVVILGGILFHANITAMGWVSVSFGVLAGMIFAVAKARGAVTKVDTEDDRGSDRDEVSVDASEISDDDRVEDPLMK